MRTAGWLLPLLLAAPALAGTRVVVQNNTPHTWRVRLEAPSRADVRVQPIGPAARATALLLHDPGDATATVRASITGGPGRLGVRFVLGGGAVRFGFGEGVLVRLGSDETRTTRVGAVEVVLRTRDREVIELALWEAPPAPAETGPDELSVLAWNVWLRPTTLFANAQRERVRRMADLVAGHDVLVLSEAFDDDEREVLLEALRPRFPYASRVVGKDKFLAQDGGVIVVSRWPITAQAQEVYRDYSGSDAHADKGVIWVRIEKQGRRWNLLGTHLQAGAEAQAAKVEVRARQLRQLAAFLQARGIPADEPVLLAGDLNVDLRAGPGGALGAEMTRMLELVGAARLPLAGPLRFTYDAALDPLASEQVREHLDHVLVSRAHAPLEGSARVLALRSREPFRLGGRWSWDLSDHFAVAARVRLATPARGLVAGLEER